MERHDPEAGQRTDNAEIAPTATHLRFLRQLRHRIDRAHAPATADQDLGHHHRHANQRNTAEVKQYKGTAAVFTGDIRSEEHTSELQSREKLVCRLLLEKKNNN